MEILLATTNKGKVIELVKMLDYEGVRVLSLSDFPEFPEIDENGSDFSENALIKARAAFEYTGLITLADDSGLEVDALNGAPGIFSARYAGEPKDDERNILKLLADLNDIPPEGRTARFCCCLAIVAPGGKESMFEGTVEGMIIQSKKGSGGFGYDPIFYLPEYEKTMAELTIEEKNTISHRARAYQKAVSILRKMLLD